MGMNEVSVIMGIAMLLPVLVCAQQRDEWGRINRFSHGDHQLVMKCLGIAALRPGPSGA